MRGHKHPLEIFRQNGQSFPTRDGAVPPAPVPRAEVVGAPLILIQPRRLVKPRSGKRTPTLATTADADPRPARRPPSPPRASALVSVGLVLLVGVTYAVGLWPFARAAHREPAGSLSRGGERSFLADAGCRRIGGIAAGRRGREGPDGARRGPSGDRGADRRNGKARGRARPELRSRRRREYWVVVASVTLTEADRRKACRVEGAVRE
jgi:hypothetical protein